MNSRFTTISKIMNTASNSKLKNSQVIYQCFRYSKNTFCELFYYVNIHIDKLPNIKAAITLQYFHVVRHGATRRKSD